METRRCFDIKKTLEEIKYYKNIFDNELANSPDGKLIYAFEKGQFHRYYRALWDNGKRKCHRITSNPEMVSALARKAFLEETLSVYDHNLSVLESALGDFDPSTNADIAAALQEKYPQIPLLDFLKPAGGLPGVGIFAEKVLYLANFR